MYARDREESTRAETERARVGWGGVGWVEWLKLSQRVSGPRLKDLSFYTKGNGEPLVALGLVFI